LYISNVKCFLFFTLWNYIKLFVNRSFHIDFNINFFYNNFERHNSYYIFLYVYLFIYDRIKYFIKYGIPRFNFIIIYLGAICVLILFQAKLVKLLTEKNNKVVLNSFLFIPCLFIFLFFPIMQFISIYFSTYEFELLTIRQLNTFFSDLMYINWFDKFKNINTLVVLGFICISIISLIF
jgi:hypothetical protein